MMKRLAEGLIAVIWTGSTVGIFFTGVFFSKSAWTHGFDLGWLLVILLVYRSMFWFIGENTRKVRDYAVIFWPALPGFLLQGLASLNFHNWKIYSNSRSLEFFGVFSCCFLLFVVSIIALSRFGFERQQNSARQEQILRRAVWMTAVVIAMIVILRTCVIFVQGERTAVSQLVALQAWFYTASLITYLLLIMKTMLPLLLSSYRAALPKAKPLI